MLVNAAYCGYVGGLRSKDRSVRGLHEPLVSEELFDRVQEIRAWRTRVVKPGRPSEDYLLRKLLHCERCGSRMHGTRGSRAGIRRYMCSTRRYSHDCTQAIVKAEPLEAQLVDWIRDFQPDSKLRAHVLATLRAEAQNNGGNNGERRRELHGQLDRLRDLYVLGDLTKNQYVLRRQAFQEELERTSPPLDPNLDQAEALLSDFARFWQTEPSPAERRKLLASLFDKVWQDGGLIVAVKPRPPFVRYFKTAERLNRDRKQKRGDKGGSDGGRSLTLHTRKSRFDDGDPADRDHERATVRGQWCTPASHNPNHAARVSVGRLVLTTRYARKRY
jgi:hypothetical protein